MMRLLLSCLAFAVLAASTAHAHVASPDYVALECKEQCQVIRNTNGDPVGNSCLIGAPGTGGWGCLATPTSCSVNTRFCDWVEAFNSDGQPVWSGRLCDPRPGSVALGRVSVDPDPSTA